jgi:multiple sugar transport system substrate-binding protein
VRRGLRGEHGRRGGETECGILTTIINKFEADNPDLRVKVNVVAWPGYRSCRRRSLRRPSRSGHHAPVGHLRYQGAGCWSRPTACCGRPASTRRASPRGARRCGQGRQVYGLPWDTIGRLFHVNTRLMEQAGLMRDGKPVLPTSPEELLQHARHLSSAPASPT